MTTLTLQVTIKLSSNAQIPTDSQEVLAMRLSTRWWSAAFLFVLLRSTNAPAEVRFLYEVQAAEEISQKTGKPILAIAGTTDCKYCRQMAGELENNEQLQPLASQYVILKMDTAGAEFPGWAARFECKEGGVPKVYVIRADGKQLLGETGAPQDMDGFLKRYLQDAGTILDARELAEVEKAAKNAQKAMRRKAWADAIEIVAKEPGKGSYAAAAQTVANLAGELAERAKAALADAEKKLESKDKPFDGALALVEAQRQFGELAAAKELLDAAVTQCNEDPKMADLLAQAELFEKGRHLEGQRKWREALEAFQELAEKHPDSPGTTQAAKHVTDLEKRVSVASGAKTGPSKKSTAEPEVAADEKRASSYLKMAKQFEKKDPAKARDYCEKAVKAAPDSATAKEAADLLKALGTGGK